MLGILWEELNIHEISSQLDFVMIYIGNFYISGGGLAQHAVRGVSSLMDLAAHHGVHGRAVVALAWRATHLA